MRQRAVQQKKDSTSMPDIAKSYNAFKTFRGEQYTGMKVGKCHKWYMTRASGRKKR